MIPQLLVVKDVARSITIAHLIIVIASMNVARILSLYAPIALTGLSEMYLKTHVRMMHPTMPLYD